MSSMSGLTPAGVARQIVSAAGSRRGPRHRATAGRRVWGICLVLNSYEASNPPVERTRQPVGGEAGLVGRAAHRRVMRTA